MMLNLNYSKVMLIFKYFYGMLYITTTIFCAWEAHNKAQHHE